MYNLVPVRVSHFLLSAGIQIWEFTCIGGRLLVLQETFWNASKTRFNASVIFFSIYLQESLQTSVMFFAKTSLTPWLIFGLVLPLSKICRTHSEYLFLGKLGYHMSLCIYLSFA